MSLFNSAKALSAAKDDSLDHIRRHVREATSYGTCTLIDRLRIAVKELPENSSLRFEAQALLHEAEALDVELRQAFAKATRLETSITNFGSSSNE